MDDQEKRFRIFMEEDQPLLPEGMDGLAAIEGDVVMALVDMDEYKKQEIDQELPEWAKVGQELGITWAHGLPARTTVSQSRYITRRIKEAGYPDEGALRVEIIKAVQKELFEYSSLQWHAFHKKQTAELEKLGKVVSGYIKDGYFLVRTDLENI